MLTNVEGKRTEKLFVYLRRLTFFFREIYSSFFLCAMSLEELSDHGSPHHSHEKIVSPIVLFTLVLYILNRRKCLALVCCLRLDLRLLLKSTSTLFFLRSPPKLCNLIHYFFLNKGCSFNYRTVHTYHGHLKMCRSLLLDSCLGLYVPFLLKSFFNQSHPL